jgi:hypothetical protein
MYRAGPDLLVVTSEPSLFTPSGGFFRASDSFSGPIRITSEPAAKPAPAGLLDSAKGGPN